MRCCCQRRGVAVSPSVLAGDRVCEALSEPTRLRLLEQLPFALFDDRGRYRSASPAWCALFGLEGRVAGRCWRQGGELDDALGEALAEAGEEVRELSFCRMGADGICRRLGLRIWRADEGVVAVVREVAIPRDCDPVVHRQQQQLALAARIARLGYWHYDFRSGGCYWSPELWRIVGRSPESFPLTFARRLEVFHPEDRQERQRVWAEAIAARRGFTHRARILRPDGSVRHVFTRGLCQLTEEGEIAGYFGILQDITEEVELEQRLRREAERNRLYRALFEHLPEPAWITDREGRCRLANPAACRQLGLRPLEDADGDPGPQAEAVAGLRRAERRVLRTGDVVRTVRRVSGSEGCRWMAVLLAPLRDEEGAVVGVLGYTHDVTAEQESQRLLRRERQRLERVNRALAAAKGEAERMRDLFTEATAVLFDGFALFDPEDRLVVCNEAFSRLYRKRPQELVGWTFEQLQRLPAFRAQLGIDDEERFELWLARRLQIHKRGSERPREVSGASFCFLVHERRLSDGSIVLCRTDIAPLKRTEAELRTLAHELAASKAEAEQAHALLREATATLSEGFALFDPEGRLVLCNRSFAELHEAAPEALVGRPFRWFVDNHLERFGPADAAARRRLGELSEHRFAVGDGTPLEIEAGARWFVVRHHRMVNGYRVLLRSDITHLKRVEEELRRLATVDDLTELANRRAFFEQGRRLLARCRRNGQPLAVLLFDLDHFKAINDTHGHEAGDCVLAEVARRCRALVRPGDLLARLGGEEFALLLPETDEAAALRVAERLRRAISGQKIRCAKTPLAVTASFGLASSRRHAGGLDRLLAVADQALYRAKRAGRDRIAGDLPSPSG